MNLVQPSKIREYCKNAIFAYCKENFIDSWSISFRTNSVVCWENMEEIQRELAFKIRKDFGFPQAILIPETDSLSHYPFK